MYLKNLTVFGFKSFADKTGLNFQPGVTAIVGPNGCGKSNVSDAIRWVLGEQSAKALRGGEMADVIFNGTDGRKPMGMGEVSLTLGGVDAENLRAAGVEVAYEEVTLTRRIFRDGGSEYFLNRTPCRLRDIQQLFMGTGIGRTSYSILAQGHITQILSSKPEDRRMIFEEAAGITRFKSQKKESLRKLESTDQNLLRVADLIKEVKRQIGSLQRQAGKAKRYKQIAAELQHLETQLARHQFDVLNSEIAARQQSVEQLRGDIDHGTAEILRLEGELTRLREQLAQLDQQVATQQHRGLELKGEIERHQSRIQFSEERLASLDAQNADALAEITRAGERCHAATAERALVAENLLTAEKALAQHRETLATRRDALAQVEDDARTAAETLRAAQSAAFTAAQDLSRLRNELSALDLQKKGNHVRLEKLSSEKITLEVERGLLETRLQEFTASVDADKLQVATTRGSVEQRQARLRDLAGELTSASTSLDQLVQQQADKRSRLNVLQQLEGSHEGFDAGAVAALRQSNAVLGSLADRIRVPDQFVTAVENALGHHLQLVLTEQPSSAQQILAELSAAKSGRASIAALAMPPCHDESQLAFSGEMAPAALGGDAAGLVSGQMVYAMNVIQAEQSVEPLLKSLLGRTFIAADLATATTQIQNGHAGCDFVTLSGELLSRHGVFTGGYLGKTGSGQAPSSILGRKNQITELQAEMALIEEKVAVASRQRGALLAEQTELSASLQQAQSELRQQEVAIATRAGEFNVLQNSERVLQQKIATVVFEIQSLAAQETEAQQKNAELMTRLADFEIAERAAQESVRAQSVGLEDLRLARDAANAALTDAKVALAADEQLTVSYRHQATALEQRIAELTRTVKKYEDDCASFLTRRQQAESEMEESRSRIERLEHERNSVNELIAGLLSRKTSEESEIAHREAALRDQRQHLTTLQAQRSALEIELAQKNMSVEALREKVSSKYHVSLDDIRSECITITFADEGPAKVETLTPEAMAASGLATDWASVGRQVSALQQRLDEIGPVNLVAIEEYEETEQRHQFLTKQHDDLVAAKAQLLEVINRINTQTRLMFAETFEKIRQNFQLMFTEVFGGGKADLVLADTNDVLESGIDIIARPPGKQLQSISLLSGGEQTMTAVALLFSIYQVKPSPFCVLDELDAPLDESNVVRFVKILQRFLAHSQFIIITHNKRTIAMADVLYGVTMQEHGVSKIVSVKFHKAQETSPEAGQPPSPVQLPAVPALEPAPAA